MSEKFPTEALERLADLLGPDGEMHMPISAATIRTALSAHAATEKEMEEAVRATKAHAEQIAADHVMLDSLTNERNKATVAYLSEKRAREEAEKERDFWHTSSDDYKRLLDVAETREKAAQSALASEREAHAETRVLIADREKRIGELAAERDASESRASALAARVGELEKALFFYGNREIYEETSMVHGRIPACGPPIVIEDCGERARSALSRPAAGATPSLDALALEADLFARTTFPARSAESISEHLRREATELAANPRDPEEMADVFILLGNLVHYTGTDLNAAVVAKLAKNRARRWGKPDTQGVVEHIREARDECPIHRCGYSPCGGCKCEGACLACHPEPAAGATTGEDGKGGERG